MGWRRIRHHQPAASDLHLGSFYGLAMPLLKHGIPVEPVQVENATAPNFLDRYKVLLLTYEGQKPPTPEFHKAIAAWVKQGGVLFTIANLGLIGFLVLRQHSAGNFRPALA